MNYFIFGGSGFIGTHLIKLIKQECLKENDRIYDLDIVMPGEEGVVPGVVEKMEAAGEDFRMLVLPDHPTPVAIRTHVSDPVPYMLYDSTDKKNNTWSYNEKDGEASGNYIAEGHTIINRLFEK